MNPTQAGGAAGIFFWGYVLLQIPGGHLAQRWSAKRFVSHLAGGVGALFRGLRLGPDLAAILGDAPFAGSGGGRRVARRAGAALALVPAWGTRARQCLLDALPSHRRDRFLSPFGMDSGPMELARAADCRRRVAFPLAGHLVGFRR